MTIAALAPYRGEPVRRPADDDFTGLYRQYRPQLLRYITHHFGPRDADEITQEALTRALRSLDRDRSDAETWAWLVRVARNVAHDLARSRRICDATDDDAVLANDVPDDAILPEPAALLDEKRRLVRAALKTLPPSQRRILVLYEVDELNCPAIARLVGSTEDAVRKALQRARRRFAAEVRALGGGAAGSVVWLLRGLKRRSLATPAASASTAFVALAGTVALTVGVQTAPQRELTPDVASPVAASAPDADLHPDRPAVVRRVAAPSGTSRSAVRPSSVRPTTPGVNRDGDTGMVKIKKPMTPLNKHDRLRIEVLHTPWGPLAVDWTYTPGNEPGVVCGTALVDCEE